jgi:hypothetical protein
VEEVESLFVHGVRARKTPAEKTKVSAERYKDHFLDRLRAWKGRMRREWFLTPFPAPVRESSVPLNREPEPHGRLIMKMMVLACLFLMALTGCSIKTSVKPVGNVKVSDLCIKTNPRVLMEGFLPELEMQIRNHGIKPRMFDSVMPSDCARHLEYTANWQWDLAMYLTYAELRVYEQANLIGEAIYDARWGGFRLDKFGTTGSKLQPLVDELFGPIR